MRRLLILLACPLALVAQRPDSIVRLPDIPVTVTRTPTTLGALGSAVTIIDSAELHRNRLSPTLDDALAFVPGVVIGNRFNFSLDQRLSIRGFGARANFGWRGVKVLLDGVPQTLPDGQSQLNGLKFSQIDRAEILRGAASAEYGNASGGVISFTSRAPSESPSLSIGGETGSNGSTRFLLEGSGKAGALGGTLALSRFITDGSRQHAGAEQRRLLLGATLAMPRNNSLALRLTMSDDPLADNPGALTAAELAANRDSASASNLRRDAGKIVRQSQLSLAFTHNGEHTRFEAVTWGLVRDLDNPLAAPPPAPAGATEGTWVGIERRAGGFRSAASFQRAAFAGSVGVDLQTMRDNRINERSLAGIPQGTRLLDQTEEVTEAGPFARIDWHATSAVTLAAGARWDRVAFSVADHLLNDGNGSGDRTMSSPSGSLSLSWARGAVTLWTSLATAFETPTTTELANLPSGENGLNHDLDPQHSVSVDLGMRATTGRWRWDIAAWSTTTRDAIVPAQDVGGRTYYQNAGRTRTTGAEGTIRWRPWQAVEFLASATLTHATFVDYFSALDNLLLDDHELAGVPEGSGRLGVRASLGGGWSMEMDQMLRGPMFADDRNSIAVADLGTGITSLRLGWTTSFGPWHLTGFAAAANLFDRDYVGSVTINGAGGRVFEPAAGRTLSFGVKIAR